MKTTYDEARKGRYEPWQFDAKNHYIYCGLHRNYYQDPAVAKAIDNNEHNEPYMPRLRHGDPPPRHNIASPSATMTRRSSPRSTAAGTFHHAEGHDMIHMSASHWINSVRMQSSARRPALASRRRSVRAPPTPYNWRARSARTSSSARRRSRHEHGAEDGHDVIARDGEGRLTVRQHERAYKTMQTCTAQLNAAGEQRPSGANAEETVPEQPLTA